MTANPDRAVRPVRSRSDWLLGSRRVAEARSEQTAPDRLRLLASDEVRPVRLWTARNPRTPQDALAELCRDEDRTVVWNAIRNPSTPGGALRRLADDEERRVGRRGFLHRSFIVHHPNVPSSLRDDLLASGVCDCPGRCAGRAWFSPR